MIDEEAFERMQDSIPAEMWRDCFGEHVFPPAVVAKMIANGCPSDPDWAKRIALTQTDD